MRTGGWARRVRDAGREPAGVGSSQGGKEIQKRCGVISGAYCQQRGTEMKSSVVLARATAGKDGEKQGAGKR